MKTKTLCVGLFGTCDNIRWRDQFMADFEAANVRFFNPMVENWDPSMAAKEAEHLANDDIILFPVLGASYGIGSLAEIGFGPLKAVVRNQRRSFVFLVDEDVSEDLKSDIGMAKASKRGRALVRAHLLDLKMPNVYMVRTLQQMFDLSIKLHAIHSELDEIQAHSA